MRKVLASLALLITLSPQSGHAATINVTIAGFQYSPSGWVTADPGNFTPDGAGTTRLPAGTPHDAPAVRRGDTVSFSNLDPVAHTVTYAAGEGTWSDLSLAAQASARLTIPAAFPTGSYVYRCTIHQGMRGSFTVTP